MIAKKKKRTGNSFIDNPSKGNRGWDERIPPGLKRKLKNRKNYGLST